MQKYQTYLEWKKSTIAPTSVHNYQRWVNRFENYRNEQEYSLELVSKYKNSLQGIYAPRNIQFGLSILRDYLGYLVVTEHLDFPLKLFRIKQERSISHLPVTKEEHQKIVELLSENEPIPLQRKVMLSLLFDTGMRVGELLRLRIRDITERGALILNEKNHRSRIIAWSPETNRILQRYLLLREGLQSKEDWVFVSFKYRPCKQMSTRNVELIIEHLKKKAGVSKRLSPHSWRHGFVHRKLDEGKPVTTIAQMLGHSTAMNVLTYAKMTGKEIREAWGLS